MEYWWKKTKKRATHNQYCKEFAALTVSVEKALAYFATHPATVVCLFGRYGEESGLELKEAAQVPKANLNIYKSVQACSGFGLIE
jgi:hypothetical protein